METSIVILSIALFLAGLVLGFLVDRVYWFAKLFSVPFINQNSKVMKKETNVFKQIIGALLMLLAGVLGFETAPEMAMSFGAVLLSVYVLTDLVKPYVSELLVQIVSWVWGILLSLLAWWLGLGMYADMTLLFSLITGFVVSLAANGIYDAQWLESLWHLLRGLFPSKKTNK